ncbi:MAG: hypothetical protein WCX27_01675 [Candidatus Paceibacterota bacterium]|jgi:hypothetical protein
MTIKPIIKYFDRLEDRMRSRLSHRPILYAFIGGLTIVFFWRGVWGTADIIMHQTKGIIWFLLYEPVMLVWSTIILLMTGLFFSFFIGDRLIISGIQHEKKIEEKTADEIVKEETEIKDMITKINQISKDIEDVKHITCNKINGANSVQKKG